MTIRAFNSIQGYSVGSSPQQDIILANGDITTVNFTANGVSNLGPISNVKITGGAAGQSIITDGNGNLTFSTTTSNSAAPMPYYIPTSQSYVVPANFQGLFSRPIEIDGELEIDGVLIEVNPAYNANSSQVLFLDDGNPAGTPGFTFDKTTGTLSLPGTGIWSGNLLPSANITYDLGSMNNRWNDLYLAGNSIIIGDSIITASDGNLTFTNATGGQLIVSGSDTSTTSAIANSASNVVVTSSNVTISANGVPDVVLVDETGVVITGNAAVTGLLTDNYYYANGQPLDFSRPAGSNTELQFNNNNDFGSSSNLRFDSSTSLLTVTGNIATGNASVSGQVSAGYLISSSGCVTVGSGLIGVVGTQAGIFVSSITDINLGFAANITAGSLTGQVTVRNNLNVNNTLTTDIASANTITTNNITSDTVQVGDLYSKRPSIPVTVDTVIDSFGVNEYRSAKYTIKISDNTGYQALEVLLIHNNINSIITVYGSLSMTGLDLITLTTAINGSNVNLIATGVNANTSVNLMGTYVPD